MRTIAIGDIHGGLKALVQLLNTLEIKDEDHLIFMGDYVDGWSKTRLITIIMTPYTDTHC